VDRDFLFYYLVNTPLAKDNADGYPTLRLGDIVQLSVQVPPLTEQRRIARILSTINRSLEATVKALEACAIVKRSLVAKEFDLSSYSTVSFRDICDILSVGIVVRPTQYYSNEGVIALRSLNVREDELDLTNSVRITSEAHEGPVAKSALRPGDVVIVRTGYPGTSAVIPAEFPQVNCIDLVFARPGLSVRSEYLSRFLNSPSGREQALKAKTGLAQQHLNVAAVGRTSLPLPPLDVQDQIVRRLRTIDRVLVGVRQRKQVLEAVLSSAIEELIGTAA
jgi:type I restriction enzyme S subunit